MSFPAYEFYKDSGVEWLEQVPNMWEVRTISSLTTKITNGYVGPTRGILVDDGVRYLQSLHIKQNEIRFNTPYYVTEEWSNEHEKSILETGDVLVVQTGDIGQVAVVPDEFAGCNCHALIILAPRRDEVSGVWISWVFNSDFGFHSLMSIKTGALHPHLNCGNVKYLKIPVPPVDEQKAISSFLDVETSKIDGLVSEQRRLIELLKEKRQAVISHAVTKGLNPNAPMKPSGIQWLGDVPQHWTVSRLKYVKARAPNPFVDGPFGSNLKSQHFVENGDVYVIESNFATTGRIEPDKLKTITAEHFETVRRSETKGGDIIIAKIGARFGMSSVLPTLDKPALVSGNSMKLTINDQICDLDFINWQLANLKQLGAMDDIVNATAQPALSLGGMNGLPILLPSLDEQKEIVVQLGKRLERFDSLEAEAERAIELLQERRTALISAAVTGKIDVRDFASQGANA